MMKSNSKSRLSWSFIVFVFIGTACQRSHQFLHEEEFGRIDGSKNYYEGTASLTATQKVELLGQPKKRVMILGFWNDTPVRQDGIGEFAADELKRALLISQRVILPHDVKTTLSTSDFVEGEQVKVAQLIAEGRKMGVTIIIIGRITKVVFRQKGDDIGFFHQKQSLLAVSLETKVFDVQGGREVLAAARSGEASSSGVSTYDSSYPTPDTPAFRFDLAQAAVREAVAGVIPDVLRAIEKMTWQGRIAKVIGPKFYVNAGRTSGLIGGDILRVLNPGEDIYDPVTGAYLGRSQGQLKGTLEIVDFIGPDGAVSEVHTGGNFREGDLVQLY